MTFLLGLYGSETNVQLRLFSFNCATTGDMHRHDEPPGPHKERGGARTAAEYGDAPRRPRDTPQLEGKGEGHTSQRRGDGVWPIDDTGWERSGGHSSALWPPTAAEGARDDGRAAAASVEL